MLWSSVCLLALAPLGTVPGCHVGHDGVHVRQDLSSRDRQQIIEILTSQDAAWNAGDIDAFMEPYWHSDDLTFSSGGKVTRGWQATLDGYRSRYPTREAMGRLSFTELEITSLSPDAALVLGRWRLERQNPLAGAFTLVMRRIGGRWVIVHDHTSKDAP